MNRVVAKSLAQNLITLDYITRAAGCVQEIILPVKGTNGKKLPAATEVYTAPDVCNTEETYKDLIPNSKETGILYFEDLGSKLVEKNSRREKWRGSLKLVCWLQVAEICNNSHTLESLEDIVCGVSGIVNDDIATSDKVLGGKIRVVQEYPKRPSPFEKYDYDEKERQYLIHPFDYFSLRIDYWVYLNANCC